MATEKKQELDSKQKIYQMIADYVRAKTGKNIGRKGGQDVFNLVNEQTFASAVQDGNFRFNGGYGSLRMKQYQAGTRQLPSGAKTTFGERRKLRYEQGVSTTALVEGKAVKSQVVMPTEAPAAPPKAAAPAPAPKAAKAPKATPVPAVKAAAATAAPADTVNLE